MRTSASSLVLTSAHESSKRKGKISCPSRDFGFAFDEIKCKMDPKHLRRRETFQKRCSLQHCLPPKKGYLWTATSKHLKEESSHTGISLPMLYNLPVPRLFHTVPHSIAKRTVRSNRAPVTKVFSVLKSSRKLMEAREGKSQGEKTC